MKKFLDIYSLVLLKDCNEFDCLGAVMLNTQKHTIGEFQGAIDDAREKHYEDIQLWGNDWEFIKEELTNFDYIELNYNDKDDYVVF